MKKLLIILFAVLMVFSTSAQTITVLHDGVTTFDDGTTIFSRAEKEFAKFYPQAKINWIKLDLSDGSTLTMDAMLAAGEAPDLYLDSPVRASKYMIPEFAAVMPKSLVDVFTPSSVFYIGGKPLGVLINGSAQGMCINLDIMKDIGYTVKPDWTINDFLYMAELVKQKYGGKKFATGMFAANQSGDYLLNNWYASFGVKWYENGKYDKSFVAKNGGEKVYEFYQTLVKNGYVPPNAATLNDDDYAADWAIGKFAATAFFPGWTKPYFDTAIQQKLIEKPFEYTFVPFPRASKDIVPGTYVNGSVAVLHKSSANKEAMVAKLVQCMNTVEIANKVAEKNIVANVKGAKLPADPYIAQTATIMATNGVHDFGLFDRRFTERRSLQYPILQQVLNFKLTPKEAIEKFEKALNSVK
jgi:ABC-type glycerol-3-phosphate transport system substrate-binding protein